MFPAVSLESKTVSEWSRMEHPPRHLVRTVRGGSEAQRSKPFGQGLKASTQSAGTKPTCPVTEHIFTFSEFSLPNPVTWKHSTGPGAEGEEGKMSVGLGPSLWEVTASIEDQAE